MLSYVVIQCHSKPLKECIAYKFDMLVEQDKTGMQQTANNSPIQSQQFHTKPSLAESENYKTH